MNETSVHTLSSMLTAQAIRALAKMPGEVSKINRNRRGSVMRLALELRADVAGDIGARCRW
jgi:hypothetical protein